MDDSFELNISNYTISELENLLELRNPYTSYDVNHRKTILKEKVLSEPNMNIERKNNIADFLENVSIRILTQIEAFNREPTFNDFKNKLVPGTGSSVLIQNPSVLAGLKSDIQNGRLVDDYNQPPGIINPINVKTIKKTINIDTRFRPNYYGTSSTNFTITLPTKVKKAVSMRIASLEIPISYYVVSKKLGNSFFKIEWDSDGTGGFNESAIVILPDGNYEPYWQNTTKATDLATTVNSVMHALPDISGKLTDIIYDVDRTSGKSVFYWDPSGATIPEPFRVTFNIDDNGNLDSGSFLQFELGWLFGFRKPTYTYQVGDNDIRSEGICLMKGPRYAFICIKDYNNSVNDYFTSAFTSSILQEDILARINLTYIQQDNGVYQVGQDDGFSTQINRQRNYFGPVDIERLEIKLIDEYGRVIDLNYMDWSMALIMECLYD
jgi:hypothetical protein